MNRKEVKRQLSSATTPQQRVAAVRAALSAGMPLNEIEQYLDWLENTRRRLDANEQPEQRHSSPTSDNAASGESDSPQPYQQGKPPPV